MITINENYLKLQTSYLFSDIAKKVEKYTKENLDKKIIRLGIGDVVYPLPEVCIESFIAGVKELGEQSSFKGYGPSNGYDFLRSKIAKFDFQDRGVEVFEDEIFVSDGSKCDTGNFQELFAQDIKVAIPDPVYPVYVDTNVMAGRTKGYENNSFKGLVYLDATKDNNFIPNLPQEKVDLIYLCFPNNPTGTAITKEELTKWVDFAKENKALILYDAAYESFVTDSNMVKSIYEVEGARKVAVEFRSFSKSAGFTGVRCAYTIVPKECIAYDKEGGEHKIFDMWNRRHSTKFNGVSYPVQKAAEAVYSDEGRKQVQNLIDGYMKNAKLIFRELTALGYDCTGGVNSPYIWVDAQKDSWDFFDTLLKKTGIVCTPGEGFGKCGKQYVRFSAFNTYSQVEEAMKRIKNTKKEL